MTVHARSRRGPRGGDNGAHWISYSDMMASLLLVFVLAVVYSVYQYYNMLDIKTQQLNEQQAELDKATVTLVQREEELEAANVTLMGKQEELAAIQIQLDQQKNDLNAAQDALKTKEEEQALLQLQLAEQADKLAAMQTVLDAQKTEMLNQQQRLDALIGVRTEIIQELTTALNRASPDELLERLRVRWPDLAPTNEKRGNGPAHYYKSAALQGRVGFIDAVSHKFCQSCNRVRLTSTGLLKPCLCYDEAADLRTLLRAGCSDAELRRAMEERIFNKPRAHSFDSPRDITEKKAMSQIGG